MPPSVATRPPARLGPGWSKVISRGSKISPAARLDKAIQAGLAAHIGSVIDVSLAAGLFAIRRYAHGRAGEAAALGRVRTLS